MKRIIVALLCVAHGTCLPILLGGIKEPKKEQTTAPRRVDNSKERETQTLKLLERQTEALELLAVSQAMTTCLKIQEHNQKSILQYSQPSCFILNARYKELAEKK